MTSFPRDPADPRHGAPAWRRPRTVAVVMLLLIGGFYLLREHWGHVTGAWPYLLLLACPLMHLMHGHGKQGHHHTRSHDAGTGADERTSAPPG